MQYCWRSLIHFNICCIFVHCSSNQTGDSSEKEQTLNQLLVEMDGMGTKGEVIVFAATNRSDVLDKALMRPGRFDRIIAIDLPSQAERKEMFELHLSHIKTLDVISGLASKLAAQTPGEQKEKLIYMYIDMNSALLHL